MYQSAADALTLSPPRFGATVGDPAAGERLYGRDVAGDYGVVATIRRRGTNRYEWTCTVHQRVRGIWDEEADHENSHPWPSYPGPYRSQGSGFGFLGHVGWTSNTDTGEGYVVQGGFVGQDVAELEVVSSQQRHLVRFDITTGAFVAIALVIEPSHVALIARDKNGEVVDRSEYEARDE
ncbi:hypothetical protein [Conexibacter sp. CPCC 206217]|uniref:hypothetical protein n=1 Tax=Conexibacter sp. CPCC 206217 TaxID=3064574 RepID=UPI00271AF411|nr:hypothetical protein [Conexibacter sp. CPCC 206217]MDO8210763.1 hypothetical protein [Conexibacter sp. CPCC 206217]